MATSSQQSSSSSTPVVTETPENQIIDQIGQYAESLAGQMNDWAQQQYAQTSAVTNQTVGNFFDVSQKMGNLSNTLTDQYNNVFAPQNKSLADEANSYNSAARQKVDMGQAGATQAVAGEQARQNSEQALRSYGIDPSDGRYAALDKAAAVQNAANVAGAMNTQRNADAATGQRLRSEAVQVGAQLPAAISNVNNTAIQANTGATNASLGNANTGANLNSLADKYLSTAMQIKLPPTGQHTSSQSSGSSDSGGGGGSGGGSGGGGSSGGGSGGGSSGDGWSNPNNYTQPDDGGGSRGGGGVAPSAGITNIPDSGSGLTDSGDYGGYTSYGGGDSGGGGGEFYADGGPVPSTASPSGGVQTDDVPAQAPGGEQAHLNAHEFVIPQDVALWKGQEFFQKLIDQSRAATSGASAKPTAMPAQGVQ